MMGLMPEPRVLADREACWATRLVWGALLAWLSPVILLVTTIGLFGVAASGSVAFAFAISIATASIAGWK